MNSKKNDNPDLIIISGISGSGKSTTVRQFEDMGFFCVDNLPTELIPKFLELCGQRGNEIDKVALVVDVREKKFLTKYREVLSNIGEMGFHYQVLFLDASDDVLIRRFSETRRKHPLAETSVREGLALERRLLADVKESAHNVIDTSDFSIHDLRNTLQKHFGGPVWSGRMAISLVAFGFKYRIANNADLVFDVRFLPNPYFVDGLKHLTGKDEAVIRYVLDMDETQEFLKRLYDFVDYLLPRYVAEGKSYLTLGFGCTGGRHRSVVIADAVKKHLETQGFDASIWCRDIERG
ncbi:MAG: RNase adapter RapZ [bacterium]|nr:RNase adapter RapZ [bacterium]